MHEPLTILVVDDEPDILELLEFAFESRGFRVVTATNGREALDELEHETPDLILLDMRMPVLNGWEFAATLRDQPGGYPAPIVVATAAGDPGGLAQEIGAAGWVAKPFNVRTLVSTVRRVLGVPNEESMVQS